MKMILSILIAFLAVALPVQAHAFLDHSEPKVGSKVTTSPRSVQIWFTMEVDPTATQIAVYDAAGKEIDRKDSKIDPKNHALMSVTLPTLPKGSYQVVWKALCPYGHHTDGKFMFEVAM